MSTSQTNSKSPGSGKESLGKVTALFLTSAMKVGTGIYTTLGKAACGDFFFANLEHSLCKECN